MLVLSRNEGQKIVIGDDIVITVLGTSGGRVRLGIEAPRSVGIRRSELEILADSFQDWEAASQALALN